MRTLVGEFYPEGDGEESEEKGEGDLEKELTSEL